LEASELECYCVHHVHATIATNPYAEAALGNRAIF
jgi:hypothetical protein